MTETVSYGLFFKEMWVKPGSRIKIKGKWKTYTYISMVCLGHINDTWILCEDSRGNQKRFRPGDIKRVLVKRSYLKNV